MKTFNTKLVAMAMLASQLVARGVSADAILAGAYGTWKICCTDPALKEGYYINNQIFYDETVLSDTLATFDGVQNVPNESIPKNLACNDPTPHKDQVHHGLADRRDNAGWFVVGWLAGDTKAWTICDTAFFWYTPLSEQTTRFAKNCKVVEG